MTVGDPIVHNWRIEDPNTSQRADHASGRESTNSANRTAVDLTSSRHLLPPTTSGFNKFAKKRARPAVCEELALFEIGNPISIQVCDSRKEGKLPIRGFMVHVDLGLNRTRAHNYCRVDLNPAGSSTPESSN
ncbi:hypothetical protein ASPBRDRAFT_672475 [Aspergillus brasiliensis CBS 101740]|uniref:Uncharacterized protein n=1 Tax=Aspergillus brasiliensis (strain CBS 101740 / IMI 381727 / IBT 21946) TaxID=767769 RepID=A0A1L9UL36_ASPBC|nr:hypothetical protein ASPBRDRAFT_672475 [Aspergillus brasiliensis CBS 101740]